MPFQVDFSINADQNLIATVTGAGDGGVENGLALQSTSFHSDGSVDIILGAAIQSVSAFCFVLNGESANFIVSIAADNSFAVLPTPDSTLASVGAVPADPTILSRFFGGITDVNVTAALAGALENWIAANATAIPVLIILGLVTEGAAFWLAVVAQGGDLIEMFVEQILAQEISAGVLSTDEANQVKTWAKAGDGVLQLPAILTTDNKLAQALSGVSAGVNFVSESQQAKLGVTIASNTVGKWVLALTALKK